MYNKDIQKIRLEEQMEARIFWVAITATSRLPVAF